MRSDTLTLSVTPQISPDGVVMLSLTPMLKAPAVAESDTLARVADGETLVISGFTRSREVRERTNLGRERRLVRPRHGRHAKARGAADSPDAEDSLTMYETYYGFAEKPFSLTPDPKYLYRSQSHANAFELLQYAIRRREGFVVVTGDIGTGKTTICRALLEQIDRTTFTALVLNPFLSEEDLLKRILQDFGVVSRENIRAGQLTGVTKQDLIETLYDFLLGLIPLKANAVLIIDEAQNLPLPVLEQIRILSNLETDKEKLLQIILVGQLDLGTLLRSPELRQLDQRVSIRYQLEPLDRETVGAYVAHRLTIAGGSAAVTFAPKALDLPAPAVGRHSASHQPDLRSRAAGGVFRPRESDHARHGRPRGREPRRAAVAIRADLTGRARRSPARPRSRLLRRRLRSGPRRISISDSATGRSRLRAWEAPPGPSAGRQRRPCLPSIALFRRTRR